MSGIGYTTGYQGAKAEFAGIRFQNRYYTGRVSSASPLMSGPLLPESGSYSSSTEYQQATNYTATTADFGTSLNFDPDDPLLFYPNIVGEMTSVFIPETSTQTAFASWVPREWTNRLSGYKNPVNTWTWNINASDGRHDYSLNEWLTKWYVHFEAGFDSTAWFVGSEGDGAWGNGIYRYSDVDVWFKLALNDRESNWYFEGAPVDVYFAISKITLTEFRVVGRDGKGVGGQYEPSLVDVIPEAQGSVVGIYYDLFGTQEVSDESTKYLSYRGQRLNPAYFRGEVYVKVTLRNFGTQSWWDWNNLICEADTITFEFDVKQFVVGEWVVQDIQAPLPPEVSRTPQVGVSSLYIPVATDFGRIIYDAGTGIRARLSIPIIGDLFILLLIGLAVFVLILIFAPWLLGYIGLKLGRGKESGREP